MLIHLSDRDRPQAAGHEPIRIAAIFVGTHALCIFPDWIGLPTMLLLFLSYYLALREIYASKRALAQHPAPVPCQKHVKLNNLMPSGLFNGEG